MNDSTELTEAQSNAVKHAIRLLVEHFDAIQIFASRHDMGSDSTQSISAGIGNHYARMGHVEHWVAENAMIDGEDDDE